MDWSTNSFIRDSTKLDKIGGNCLKLVQIGPNESYSVVSLFIWPDEVDKPRQSSPDSAGLRLATEDGGAGAIEDIITPSRHLG